MKSEEAIKILGLAGLNKSMLLVCKSATEAMKSFKRLAESTKAFRETLGEQPERNERDETSALMCFARGGGKSLYAAHLFALEATKERLKIIAAYPNGRIRHLAKYGKRRTQKKNYNRILKYLKAK